MGGRRRTVALVLAVALVAAAAVVGVRWWRAEHRTELQRALDLAPTDVERISWTAWADVRRELGTGADLDTLLDQGYDADLTSASALVGSAPLLADEFGWSPATAEWELFAQSEAGAAVVVRMPDDVDLDTLGDRLDALGYTRPTDDTGVWKGGDELLAQIAEGRGSTPLLQYVALDTDAHLLTLGDRASYLESVVEDRGDGDPDDDLAEVVEAVGEPLSASVFRGDYACSALAMSQADPSDQATADQLLAEAGEVNPLTAFAMAVRPDRDVLVAMSFENDDQARTNADSRAVLAAGPAPGQGGSFSDRFTLGDVTADGPVVTLPLKPVDGAYVLSDLSTGPVLFATC
ncbi:hypothetical protein [Nocardioides lianchengensis]|uniref:hypothetical protein n=1 Tax=Nocardioides lianchengensis TaxID=1045774 RepID=UPI001113BB10|nr:hypothetical protein [Nocardioides lianchengensis]NYG13412.1 hypothetical protein [Nocardioides lianchengensis]